MTSLYPKTQTKSITIMKIQSDSAIHSFFYHSVNGRLCAGALGIELISLKSSELKIFSLFPIIWLTHTYWALGWTNGPFAGCPQ